jgi:hypothetical protein
MKAAQCRTRKIENAKSPNPGKTIVWKDFDQLFLLCLLIGLAFTILKNE